MDNHSVMQRIRVRPTREAAPVHHHHYQRQPTTPIQRKPWYFWFWVILAGGFVLYVTLEYITRQWARQKVSETLIDIAHPHQLPTLPNFSWDPVRARDEATLPSAL